jgi:hypothetical protein
MREDARCRQTFQGPDGRQPPGAHDAEVDDRLAVVRAAPGAGASPETMKAGPMGRPSCESGREGPYGVAFPMNEPQLARIVRVPPHDVSARNWFTVQVWLIVSAANQIEPSASATAAP